MSTTSRTRSRAGITHELVRKRYGKIASEESVRPSSTSSRDSCCGTGTCCGGGGTTASLQIGYTPEEIASLPDGADLGLGCGNPTAILSLEPGDVVLDLGSGAGIDCFLAARRVGPMGWVIGVDMTPEMVTRARENARTGGCSNVEFRLGEIEHLPVSDTSVDVVISNCVINLVPDKGVVYREAFRVLRPGGRFAVSDVVATRPISEEERADPSLWSSCSSGALEVGEIQRLLTQAGFRDVRVDLKLPTRAPVTLAGQASLGVVSADIRATKPVE